MRNVRVSVVLVAVVFALGAMLGTAMADRSATAPPIVYSGQVLGASGAPIADSTTNRVSLSLYDGPSAGSDTRLCAVVSSSSVEERSGHAHAARPVTCV